MINISNDGTNAKKYIIAQIELPIEVLASGEFQILNDHAQLQFFKCNALPPSKNYDNVFLDDILHRFFSEDAEPDFVFKQTEKVIDDEPVTEPLPEPVPEPVPEPAPEPAPEPVPEPVTDPSYRIQMTSEEIEKFLVQYPPSQKRSRSKNTSFRQYKTKRNHRITSKKLDDI